MLSFVIDCLFAYFIAKKIEKTWIGIILSLVLGIVSCFVIFVTKVTMLSNLISIQETAGSFYAGIIIHPIITLIAFFVFKKKRKSQAQNTLNGIENDTEGTSNEPISNTLSNISTVKNPSLQANKDFSKTIKEEDESINSNELYEQIWKEIKENTTDTGLWAKCFSACEGDENKTKALYIKNRALDLHNQTKTVIIDSETIDLNRKEHKNLDFSERSFRELQNDFSEKLRRIENRTSSNIEKIRHS